MKIPCRCTSSDDELLVYKFSEQSMQPIFFINIHVRGQNHVHRQEQADGQTDTEDVILQQPREQELYFYSTTATN